jgi:hypothetical protein
MSPPTAIAPQVRELAGLVRAALLSEPAEGVRIDAALAEFAIHRHRCGPLLALASRNGAPTDQDAQARLDAHWDANRHAHLRNLVAGERIAATLAPAGIPALSFKGAALARMLYPEPLSRHCGDIDVLIPQRAMIAGLGALTGAGMRSGDPLLQLPAATLGAVLAFTRDIALDDEWTRSHVEVHSRLLFSKRLSAFLSGRDESLRPRPVAGDGQLPAPALGAGLALYLILHGCVSGWCRLKWLADLLPLLERLGATGRQELGEIAEQSGTAAAVKASLVLLQATFGPRDIAPLDGWLAAPSEAVDRRAMRYAAWLSGEEANMPVASRLAMLRSVLMLHDRLPDRIGLFFASGISSGLRQATGALAGLRTAPGTPPAP